MNVDQADTAPILCKHHWQVAIRRERKTGISRLRWYRGFHPDGATSQCKGKVWW